MATKMVSAWRAVTGKSLKIQIIAHTDTSNKHVRTSTRNLDTSKIVRNKGKTKTAIFLIFDTCSHWKKKFKSNLSQWIFFYTGFVINYYQLICQPEMEFSFVFVNVSNCFRGEGIWELLA